MLKKLIFLTLLIFTLSCSKNIEHVATLIGHADEITYTAFSNTDKYIVSASKDNTLILWSASDYKKVIKYNNLDAALNKVVFSKADRYMAAVTGYKTVTLWDIKTKKIIYKGHHSLNPFSDIICFSADNKHLILAKTDHKLYEVNFRKAQPEKLLSLIPPPANYFTYSPDKSIFAYSGASGNITILKADNFRRLLLVKTSFPKINFMIITKDNTHIIFVSEDKNIHVLDLKTKKITNLLLSHEHNLSQLAIDEKNSILHILDVKGNMIKIDLTNHFRITSHSFYNTVHLSNMCGCLAVAESSILRIYKLRK